MDFLKWLVFDMPLINDSNELAIVGIGCRFPSGINSPESFWALIAEGRTTVGDLPEYRRAWQGAEYKGSYLDNVEQFDARFFGVSSSEAGCMDPQQRLLLEVAWEAMENAGIDPSSLAGRRGGVFVGSFTNDYELLQARGGISSIGPYFGTGTSAAVLAGRLSYRFGFTGPALVVNTAFSSSLVALRLARKSILCGDAEFALVAGVNLILSDELSASFQAAGMLSADAQCKPWDVSANGYVRGEGCSVIMLERVSEAKARGARIWARVLGSAVNQDGASGGITAPSSTAQEELIHSALAEAGITPDSVQYIEAHGTGTAVGDPIECEALVSVFASRVDGTRLPLLLGSVKGNLGHTEAVAGLAGVIKTVLSMQHAQIPATANHRRLNPDLALERIPAEIPTATVPWPAVETGVLVAGVNSFGFSGTNAHVILAHPSEDAPSDLLATSTPHLLCLSGPTADVLKQVAHRYEDFLETLDPAALGAVCHSAYIGRQHFKHRLAVYSASVEGIVAALRAYREGRDSPSLHKGEVAGQAPRVAFLFTGQGAQYWGMGRELFAMDEMFRSTLQECDELLAPKLGCSLVELLTGARDSTQILAQTRFTQPVLFALQVSLLNMFQAWGVLPSAVLGHSIGEFAAAVAAGVMSIADGLTLVEARGRLMQELPRGGMTAVQVGVDVLEPLLSRFPSLALAAMNTPGACVVSGEHEALAVLHEQLQAQEIAFIPLDVSHAFHSSMMRGMLEPFRELLRRVPLKTPSLPFFSTATGRLASEELTRPEYWCEQILCTVRYLPALRELDALRFDACLELGPSPVLVNMAKECGLSDRCLWLGSQQNGRSGWLTALDALARLYTVGGSKTDRAQMGRAVRQPLVSLPTYPFQRMPFWFESLDDGKSIHQTKGAIVTSNSYETDSKAFFQTNPAEVLKDYYKDLSVRVQRASSASETMRPFIRFAPFPAVVPGFSWLPTFLGLPLASDMQVRIDQAHGEMRTVLLDGIEFRNVRRVLDIGCGYATDLIELAQKHAHIVFDGCNISEEQIDFGRRGIAKAGLEGRVRLHHLDSSKAEFPGLYDLVISQQVIHHIQDKDGVLLNVSEHMRGGSFLVAAEIISNLDEPIDHPPSSAHFDTKQHWAELLSRHQMRLVRCVDVSQEIANYLDDANFEQSLRELAGNADGSTIEHLYGPHALGHLLRRNLAGYFLLLVQRDYLSSNASLLAGNTERFENPTLYAKYRRPSEPPTLKAEPQAHKPAVSISPALVSPEPAPEQRATAAVMPVEAPIERICKIVGALLGCAPEAVDADQSLTAQGLNSILAMDLSKRLKVAFNLPISVKVLLNGATVSSLAQSVPGSGESTVATAAPTPLNAPASESGYADMLRHIDKLSEAEINRLLSQLEPPKNSSC